MYFYLFLFTSIAFTYKYKTQIGFSLFKKYIQLEEYYYKYFKKDKKQNYVFDISTNKLIKIGENSVYNYIKDQKIVFTENSLKEKDYYYFYNKNIDNNLKQFSNYDNPIIAFSVNILDKETNKIINEYDIFSLIKKFFIRNGYINFDKSNYNFWICLINKEYKLNIPFNSKLELLIVDNKANLTKTDNFYLIFK